jgi:hypothetical protein
VVKLGDWIDLDGGLTVAADPSGTKAAAISSNTNASTKVGPVGSQTPLLRLIVVGINSFNNKNSNGTTQHVVFQFQNIPVTGRMHRDTTTTGSYMGSDMRTYLTGNFLTGLKNAGVPDSVLWDPERKLAQNSIDNTLDTVKDKLWLPTVREMFSFEGNYSYSSPTYETVENQAWLEYYATNNSRIKYYTSTVEYYWLSSRYTGGDNSSKSYRVMSATAGSSVSSFKQDSEKTGSTTAPAPMGIAPAFCVGPGN